MKKYLIYSIILIILCIGILTFIVRTSSANNLYTRVATSTVITKSEDENPKTSTVVVKNQYIEVMDGCNPYYVGTCVNMREGAGSNYPVHTRLRTGVVLKVGEVVNIEGKDWYKIVFAAELQHPERITKDLYVASGDYLRLFDDKGDESSIPGIRATTTKRIIVDVSEQMLYACEGEILFIKESISTGLEFTPTPRGTFTIFRKTPARYMQGPIPNVSDQIYDLPGVPWDLYFTKEGAVIHGAYWHNNFGKKWSHGCINLSPENAKSYTTGLL